MPIEEDRFFNNKYPLVVNLLGHIMLGINYEDLDPIDVIKRFVRVPTTNKQDIQSTINQVEAVLALQDFPTKWLWGLLNSESAGGEDSKERCKACLKDIVAMLKKEAKKVGKL